LYCEVIADIVQISDTAYLSPLLGDLRATYDVHLRLTRKRITGLPVKIFLLGVTAEELCANID